MNELRVALLGCGTVGTEVATALLHKRRELAARIGVTLELTGILVRDADKARPGIPTELLSKDADAVLADADIVIELMGGIEPARTLILQALSAGASVVTGNKALLAQDRPALVHAANRAGVRLESEAAVAGAIPILRPLADSLAGDRITKVMGIVNGTTNYILDEMTRNGLDFDSALAQAQQLGYAEADPTADVEGHDAAAKAAIIASLAFHRDVSMADVHVEGIRSITADMIDTARTQGFVIKLLAICHRTESHGVEGISARVYPALIPQIHPLAAVSGAYNAVFVESDLAGSLMFYGQGAGGSPTASAVLGDVVSVARRRFLGGRGQAEIQPLGDAHIVNIREITTAYQVTLEVTDEPGVLLQVAQVVTAEGVSIELVEQSQSAVANGHRAKLVLATHTATDAALAQTVAALAELDVVESVLSVLRIEGK